MGYTFPRNDKTHGDILQSINRRREQEEARRRAELLKQTPMDWDAKFQDALKDPDTLQYASGLVQKGEERRADWWRESEQELLNPARTGFGVDLNRRADFVPNPATAFDEFQGGYEPRVRPEPFNPELLDPSEEGVGGRTNLERAAASQNILEGVTDNSRVEYPLDPLGNRLMVTIPPSSETTQPVLHLLPEQLDALDNVPGYAEKMMEMFPNHLTQERPTRSDPSKGETAAFMGKTVAGIFDVVSAIPEAFAETVLEVADNAWTFEKRFNPLMEERIDKPQFTIDGQPQYYRPTPDGGAEEYDPRKGLGLTIIDEGLGATTEKFRERPIWSQLLFGIVFDPLTVLGGLGLLKFVRVGGRLTPDMLATALKKADPNMSPEDVDRGVKRIMGEYNAAGAGSAQPAGGWQNLQPYTPQEILAKGGLDIDLDGPVPSRRTVSDADFQKAWDEGVESTRAEAKAREILDANFKETPEVSKLQKVIEGIELDPTMQKRIVDQLTDATDWRVRDVYWRRFIRTTLTVLEKASRAEGAIPGAGAQSPFQRKVFEVLRKEREDQIIAKPEGGQLTAPPTGIDDVERARFPDPTATAGPGAPAAAADVAGRDFMGRTYDEFLQLATVKTFGPIPDVEETWSMFRLGNIRKRYEKAQRNFLDKHAEGNAAAGRAKKNMLRILNEYIEGDLQQVNNEILAAFNRQQQADLARLAAQGVPGGSRDPRIRAIMNRKPAYVRPNSPGFAKVTRFPVEFDFEIEAALASGAIGGSIDHAKAVYTGVRGIIKHARSDLGKALNVESVNLYLAWRHGIDVIKVKQAANRVRAETASGGPLTVGIVPESQRLGIQNPASPAKGDSIYDAAGYGEGRLTHGGDTMQSLQDKLSEMRRYLEQETITRTENGQTVVTNQWKEVIRASDRVTEHYRELLDWQVLEGMVTKELAVQLKRDYKYYNPIKYVEGTLLNVSNIHKDGNKALIKGVATNDIRVLAEQGIDADFVRPLEMIGQYTMRTYMSVFRNRAMKALIPSLVWDPRNAGKVRHLIDDAGDLTTLAVLRGTKESKDMMRVARMIDGKAEVWEIPNEFEGLVDGLASFDSNTAERVLRTINKVPRSLLTAHNPVFFTYNFMHDMLAAMVIEGIMPHDTVFALAKNLRAIFKEDEFLSNWSRAGGRVGGFSGQTTEDLARVSMRGVDPGRADRQLTAGEMLSGRGRTYNELADALQNADPETGRYNIDDPAQLPEKAWRGWKKKEIKSEMFRNEFSTYEQWRKFLTSPVRLIGDVADAVEQAPRRAVAEKVMNPNQKGGPGTWSEAAYRSRRVTVDFQRRGKAMGLLDAAFLYTNAAMQGAMLPVRGMTQMGWAPRFRMAGLSAVAAGLYAWNSQDEFADDWDQMSAIDKYTKLNVLIGHKWNLFGQRVPISAAISPMLREFAIATGPVTFALDKLRGRSDQAHFGQFMQTMISQLNPVNQFTNFGGRGANISWQGIPVPTAVGNLITETMNNWDSFRNMPIVPEEMLQSGTPKTEHYDAYTSRTARKFAETFDLEPKKVDHWMRFGFVRDIVHFSDRVLRWRDPDEADPELEAMSYKFEDWLDIQTPSDAKLLSNPELSGDLMEREEEWRSKNYQRVMGEFFRDDAQYQAVLSHERAAMERILQKRWIENRTYSPDGAPIAVVTSMIDKFVRTAGGNLTRLGQIKAVEKMKKEHGIDIDVALTREVAGLLGNTIKGNHDLQIASDAALWGGSRVGLSEDPTEQLMGQGMIPGSVPTQVGLTDEEGNALPRPLEPAQTYLDGQQWKSEHQEHGKLYQATIVTLAMRMQDAAQLQGLDPKDTFGDNYMQTVRFKQDVGAWSEYKKAVATGAGAWEDTRTLGSYLASAYRGIQLYDDMAGLPDYTEFFNARAEFEEMIKEGSWGTDSQLDGEEAWVEVERELTANQTNTQYEYYNDMKHIREYWDIGRNVVEDLRVSNRGVADVWERYLDSGPGYRDYMKKDPETTREIAYAEKIVKEQRRQHRYFHPEMDALYLKWGFATEPAEDGRAGFMMSEWLRKNMLANKATLDSMAAQKQVGRWPEPTTPVQTAGEVPAPVPMPTNGQ